MRKKSNNNQRCSEASGILVRYTKVGWGVCTRRVRLEVQGYKLYSNRVPLHHPGILILDRAKQADSAERRLR